MELTRHEIEIADRYLSKRERQLAQWPRRRWLLLVIYSVLALLGYGILRDGDRSIRDDKAMDMQVSQALEKDPPPGLEHRWAVGCMMKISKILEARHQVVTASLIEVAIGCMWLISGVSMVCLIILRWNRGERDALICKLLRGKLQELEPGAAPNGGPATLLGNSGVTEGPPSVS
jgi:hypothetical protein